MREMISEDSPNASEALLSGTREAVFREIFIFHYPSFLEKLYQSITAKCHGPAPLGVGTTTAMLPTANITNPATVSTGELKEIEEYDVDFDHQFLETEDRKSTRLNSSHRSLSRMPSSA